jgi:hypothetical protein
MHHRTPRRPAFPLVRAYLEPPAGIEPATPSSGEDPPPRWQTAWYLPRSTRTSPPPRSSQRPRGRVVLPIFIRRGRPQAMSHLPETTRNRCADRHFPSSRPTVEAKVIGSLSAQLCVQFSITQNSSLSSLRWLTRVRTPDLRERQRGKLRRGWPVLLLTRSPNSPTGRPVLGSRSTSAPAGRPRR